MLCNKGVSQAKLYHFHFIYFAEPVSAIKSIWQSVIDGLLKRRAEGAIKLRICDAWVTETFYFHNHYYFLIFGQYPLYKNSEKNYETAQYD